MRGVIVGLCRISIQEIYVGYIYRKTPSQGGHLECMTSSTMEYIGLQSLLHGNFRDTKEKLTIVVSAGQRGLQL